jgi:sugar lactone lactonase YvrE
MKAEPILHIPDTLLGEGPCWDHRTRTLWWVDISNYRLHAYRPDATPSTYTFDQYVGAAVPLSDNSDRLILALHHGLAVFDTTNLNLQTLSDPETHLPQNRFNDGKCDPMGRFWAGTTEIKHENITGSLYCIEKGTIHKKMSNIHISNGLAWSSDQSQMYYIDSPTHCVQVLDYDALTGEIHPAKSIHFDSSLGSPDGMCIDTDDNLWICFYHGAKVLCIDPASEEELAHVETPASCPTSCAFGGDDLQTLYITSAAEKGDPMGGALFQVKPGAQGVETSFYQP